MGQELNSDLRLNTENYKLFYRREIVAVFGEVIAVRIKVCLVGTDEKLDRWKSFAMLAYNLYQLNEHTLTSEQQKISMEICNMFVWYCKS